MGVSQPRITQLEKSEVDGSVTLDSLERAARAMGCRVVYAIVPERPFGDTLQERAAEIAHRQLASVEQTMRLEDQGVPDRARQNEGLQRLIKELLRRPARLWDEP
jgi:predicted DNA-binding mobile mystery protein A